MSLIVSEVYDALIEAGVPEGKAKAAAAAVPAVEHLATREDIASLEQSTKADIASLEQSTKADIAGLEQSTKADIARLEQRTKAELARLEQSTKAELAKFDKSTKAELARLDKRVAVLSFAVFSLQPAILALLVKLVFFPA